MREHAPEFKAKVEVETAAHLEASNAQKIVPESEPCLEIVMV